MLGIILGHIAQVHFGIEETAYGFRPYRETVRGDRITRKSWSKEESRQAAEAEMFARMRGQ